MASNQRQVRTAAYTSYPSSQSYPTPDRRAPFPPCTLTPDPSSTTDDVLDLVDEVTAAVGRRPLLRSGSPASYLWRTEAGCPIMLQP